MTVLTAVQAGSCILKNGTGGLLAFTYMTPNDQHFTYNPLNNDDKELLLRNGYKPGELSPEEAREILADLRAQSDDDEDSDRLSNEVPGDEFDGTE